MEQIQYLMPIEGFEKSEVINPKPPEKTPFKYLEIAVTRTESSTIYLKVPRTFDTKDIKRRRTDILANACKETLTDFDWDKTGWEIDITCQSIKEVPEEIATQYEVYKMK